MVHKFCQNHLTALYDAIKAGSVADIKTIEHELTKQEKCVACAYALKAKGEAKLVLLDYLKSQGFKVEVEPKKGALTQVWFWVVRFATAGAVFVVSYFVLVQFVPPPIPFVIPLLLSIGTFLVIDQILG